MKFNEKSPKSTPENGEYEVKYPFCSVTIDDCGDYHAKYANPEDPKNTFKITQNHNGGFTISHPDDEVKALDVKMNPGRESSYTGGGSNRHTGGHSEDSGEYTSHSKYAGDTGHESGGDKYAGAAGSIIEGQRGNRFTHGTGGKTFVASTEGDRVSHVACDTHEHMEGDHISSVTGNRHVMIKNGEMGFHVQSGNMDTKVDNGQYKVKSAKDITIESDSKITLKVGRSTIVIDTNSITLKSPRIDLNP